MDGLADWPPWTTRKAPYSRNMAAVSVSSVARPSDGATTTTPRGRLVTVPTTGAAAETATAWATASGSAAAAERSIDRSPPTNAAALASRTSWACPSRFSRLIRVSVPSDSP